MPTPHSPSSLHNVPRLIRERRWWLLLLVLLALAVGAYTQHYLRQLEAQTLNVALEGARNMFRMVVLTRNWNATHGGIYVPVSERTPPNPYLDHPRRDLTTTDGQQLTMVNPAYMTRLIAEMAEADSGSVFRLTSLKPIRPENAPDDWERLALESFERGTREMHGVARLGKEDHLRYMAPLLVKESCLICHQKQGYKVGDIRGGISVSQRHGPIAQAVAEQAEDAYRSALGILALFALGGWGLLELLRKRWLELAHKMDELAATQRQLLQADKLASVGRLAAGVAHEINNPIGFIHSDLGTLRNYTGHMRELLDRCRRGEAGEADFQAIDYDYLRDDLPALIDESQGGLKRVRKIVSDLKDFARVDHAELAEADLNAGIDSTLNVVAAELQDKAEIVREFGTLPPVVCLAAQINQVVMNLLLNAAQAMEQRGRIVVRTGCTDATAWIEVEDNGRGMTAEVIAHIFEQFYTTRAVGQGTGLGLSLAYDIVAKHGGTIEVDSQPGVGSRFRVSLPVGGLAS